MRSRSRVAALALVLALAAPPALARPHHHHHHRHRVEAPARAPSFFERLFHPASAGGSRSISGRPADCRGIPWCGCWLRHHLGINDRRLDSAIAWASVGERADGPAAGVVVVWRHHVGLITENLGGGMIRLLSGNDNGAVRERPISTRALGGVVAYRKVS